MLLSTAEVYEDGWSVFSVGNHLLQPGTNILAIEVHQVMSSSSDVVLASLWTAVYSGPSPLSITNQPSSQVLTEGQSTVLTVGVEGGAGEYQWFKMQGASAVPVAYGNTPSLIFLSPLRGVDDGEYLVTVSNMFGQVTSATATLTITSTPPMITSQPLSLIVCEGDAVKFQVAAYGSPTIHYQWRRNDEDLPGETNFQYTIPAVTLDQVGTYSVAISNAQGVVVSDFANLAVVPRYPVILTSPSNFVSTVGGAAYFAVRAYGCNLTYQWQFNGANIYNYNVSNLILVNLSQEQAGTYRVIVSNPFFSVTNEAELSFFSLTLAEALNCTNLTWNAAWFAQPNVSHDGVAAAQPINNGSGVSILQTTATGPGKLSFWSKLEGDGGSDLVCYFGEQSFFLSGVFDWQQSIVYLPPGAHLLEWRFYVSSRNPANAWLDEVSFTTNVAPVINTLHDISTAPGDTVTLRGVPEGYPPLHCQWQFNGSDIPGATDPVLPLGNVQFEHQGTYSLLVSNDYGAITSSITLTLTNTAPVFHAQPVRVLAVPGGDTVISAGAFGNSPLSYQWRFGTTDLPGQTNSVLTLHDLTAEHAGRYSVRVQNEFGTSIGPEIELVVHPVSRVIHVSMDGLGGTYLASGLHLEPERYPNFMKMVNEGSTTCNARSDYENSVTLPNHICMITGRPVTQPQWKPNTVHHGYTADTSLPGTLHNNGNLAVPYKASVFDVVHDHGFSTMLVAGKTKFSEFVDSYDAIAGAVDSSFRTMAATKSTMRSFSPEALPSSMRLLPTSQVPPRTTTTLCFCRTWTPSGTAGSGAALPGSAALPPLTSSWAGSFPQLKHTPIRTSRLALSSS